MSRSHFQARRHTSSLLHGGRTALLAFAATVALLAGAGTEITTAAAETEVAAALDSGAATAPPAAATSGAAPAPPPPDAVAGPELEFRNFADKEFVTARQSGSPVVLYFEADWCEPCRQMHDRTFRDPSVIEAAKGMELFRFDMTSGDGYVDLMKKSFQVIGAPTVIVFASGGREAARRFGFIPPDDFAGMLAKARVAPTGARPAPAGS